jgi:hypothetical protein
VAASADGDVRSTKTIEAMMARVSGLSMRAFLTRPRRLSDAPAFTTLKGITPPDGTTALADFASGPSFVLTLLTVNQPFDLQLYQTGWPSPPFSERNALGSAGSTQAILNGLRLSGPTEEFPESKAESGPGTREEAPGVGGSTVDPRGCYSNIAAALHELLPEL